MPQGKPILSVRRVVLAAALVAVALAALAALSVKENTPESCVGAGCATPVTVVPVSSPDPDMSGPIKKVDCKKWFGRDGVLKYGDTCWMKVPPSASPSLG